MRTKLRISENKGKKEMSIFQLGKDGTEYRFKKRYAVTVAPVNDPCSKTEFIFPSSAVAVHFAIEQVFPSKQILSDKINDCVKKCLETYLPGKYHKSRLAQICEDLPRFMEEKLEEIEEGIWYLVTSIEVSRCCVNG